MIAHAGGIDELGIILMPIVSALGFWLLTRRRRPADGEPPRDPVIGAGEDEPAQISEHRGEGATRLHTLMDARRASGAGAGGARARREEPDSS